ncbi:hypothetical protein ACQKM9_20290 [Viridibacillus sp. NPDC093762]|uniref:hypothetical protein n=1 Tax=Viridibacillus sp. NPDC093762 TaxID=3390720 RepID=UPI003D087318
MTQVKKIEVIDVYTEFFELFESKNSLSLEHLELYYEKFPNVFNENLIAKEHLKD